MEELILKFITIHYMNEIEEEYMISRVEKEYLEDLKKRLRNKYKSPNVIKARGIFSPNSSENTGLIFNPI